ncbi:MAG: hypothetical protein ABUS47_05285 [Steroidobacter sp.]
MNTRVIMRRLIFLFCALMGLLLAACSPNPSTITYEQIGACDAGNPFSTGTEPPTGVAFVFFRILDIDNSKTTAAYSFNPQALWINTGDGGTSFDWIATAQQGSLLGFTPLQKSISVAAGAKVSVNKYAVFVVSTTDPDAAKEANNTSYFLLYHNPPNEVGKLLVRSNAQQTSWPYTPKCSDIKFPKFFISPSPKRQGVNGG